MVTSRPHKVLFIDFIDVPRSVCDYTTITNTTPPALLVRCDVTYNPTFISASWTIQSSGLRYNGYYSNSTHISTYHQVLHSRTKSLLHYTPHHIIQSKDHLHPLVCFSQQCVISILLIHMLSFVVYDSYYACFAKR
jgi:hypothetical protein